MDSDKATVNAIDSKGRRTRVNLIRTFSENFAIYFPDHPNHFVCPLCKRAVQFEKPQDVDTWVSLAHVVPKSVGGRRVVLTCARCNNHLGSRMDSAYKRAQEYHRWMAGQRTWRARMLVGGASLGVEMTKTGSNWHFQVIAKQTDPKDEKKAQHYVRETAGNFEGKIKFALYDPSALKGAMIHSAMLTLFASFGYEYALCPNADKVRAILKGKLSSPVIQKAVVSLGSSPSPPVGSVAAITRPRRFRGLVVFLPPLVGGGGGFAIVMPGFRKSDWPPYRRFIREMSGTMTFSYRTIPTLTATELRQEKSRGFGNWAWSPVFEKPKML